MRIQINLLKLFIFLASCLLANALPAATCPKIEVCFTLGEDCTAKITQEMFHAQKSLWIQAYSFTSKEIAKATVDALNRGVDVRVILDKSQQTQKYSAATFLLNHHVPTWIDYKPAIAHSKIMIIDSKEVITGSFNFTNAANEKNSENIVIINDQIIASRYQSNWLEREAVSKKLNENSDNSNNKKSKTNAQSSTKEINRTFNIINNFLR